MGAEPLFQMEGSRGSSFSFGVFVVIIGVIGSLAMLAPAFAAPQMVGPWWIYAATLVGSIALGVRGWGQSKVVVRVVAEGSGRRLHIDGPKAKLDLPLDGGVTHWISYVKGPHVGAKRLVQYNAVVAGSGGAKLGFWNLSGAEGTEPADWEKRDSGVGGGDCDEQFLCPNLPELVRAIQGAISVDSVARPDVSSRS
jgi:hypothetical protein